MFSRATKLIATLGLIANVSALANEGGGHGGGEAPAAAEGGEGKSEKKTEIKSAEESYSVVQARVLGLEAKVRSGQEEIKKLIEEKHHVTSPEKVKEIVNQMMSLHKELQKNLQEYDQQRSLLKYRYPEKSAADKREYEKLEVKSLSEMESQLSLGGSLNRTLKKVRQQYGVDPESEAKRSKKSNTPALTDPVVLKK